MGSREKRGLEWTGDDGELSGRYRRECAEMELEVSELKSALKRKNLEIEKLKSKNCIEGSRQTRVDSKTVRALQEMRTYEAFLTQENAHLRRTAGSPADVPRLQSELKDALREQQYYKAKLLALHERAADDTPSAQKRVSLPSVQSLLSTQQGLVLRMETVREELKELQEERDYFRDTVVPVLKRTVELFGHYQRNLTGEIEELLQKGELQRKVEINLMERNCGTFNCFLPLSPTSLPSQSLTTPRLALSSSQHTKSSSLPHSAPGFVYAPSYLRVKKRAVKVKIRRETQSAGTIEEVEDEELQ